MALPLALLFVAACGPSDNRNDDDDDDDDNVADADADADSDNEDSEDDQVDDLQPDDQTDDTDDVTLPDAPVDASPDARPDGAPPDSSTPDARPDAPPTPDARPDAPPTPDAGPDAPPTVDAPAAVCTMGTMGTITPTGQFAESGNADTGADFGWGAFLNNDTLPDVIFIDLYQGFGVFETATIGPGTYTLSGDESAYNTCGACVQAYSDVDFNADPATNVQYWMPTAGTLTITQVTPRMTGTLTNVTFAAISDANGTLDGTGCTATLASLSYDAEVVPSARMGHSRLKLIPHAHKSELVMSQRTCKPKL